MPTLTYKSIGPDGQAVNGEADAASPEDLARTLVADGHTVMEVVEAKSTAATFTIRRRLRARDLVVAFGELATLLESGVSLSDAVTAQSRGSYHPQLVAGFDAIGRELLRGQNFLGALRASDLNLPDYVFHLVEAGELSGTLADSLREAVQQMDYDERVASDMRGALTYPAILIAGGTAAILVVFMFVVPQFADLLNDHPDLPLLANVVLSTGMWMNDHGALLGLALVAGIVAAGIVLQRPAARQRVVDVLASAPILGQWYTELDTAKWAAVMGAMLGSRVELMDALDLAGRGVRISRRRAMLTQVAGDVRGGVALSEALESRAALTPTGYNLLRVGEQSGQLAEMARALARLYEENSARRMKRVLALIEPLAIIFIGGFLGLVMIGIMLAITSVNEVAL